MYVVNNTSTVWVEKPAPHTVDRVATCATWPCKDDLHGEYCYQRGARHAHVLDSGAHQCGAVRTRALQGYFMSSADYSDRPAPRRRSLPRRQLRKRNARRCTLCRVDTLVMEPDGERVVVPTYAAERMFGGDWKPQPGDFVTGSLWLQAYPLRRATDTPVSAVPSDPR